LHEDASAAKKVGAGMRMNVLILAWNAKEDIHAGRSTLLRES
jgi:hypothetical protein